MTGPSSLPKPLLFDEDGKVIAVACIHCGKLALNVRTGICVHCRDNKENA